MMQQSGDGTLAEQEKKDIPLPVYLLRQQGGLFVDLSMFPLGGGFAEYIDRLFGEGYRFVGLDYPVFTGLLYDYDAILEAHGIGAKMKLAGDVADFPPQRRALYKAVKVDAEGKRAEYLFEPVQIETVVEVPVYGEPGADGVAPIIGSARKAELKPTQLDLDEFLADMWLRGVRFGIDVAAVAGAIARAEAARLEVAHQMDATEGSDAEIEEASDALRRDNSPKRLANGKADLRRFQNRFPQIASGARLLKKKKRVLGKPGFKVSGAMIEPPLPADFDLLALAGEGTRVESQGANEYIVASRDGFLSLDVATNHIAVTEKIENKGGVSAKTTGDLSLAGDEFIEHGEVQEGRVVEGKNMTFRSDVYGDIVSQGGFILLEKNLSGGRARSIGGDVTSNGRVLNSTVEAWGGRVTASYAEGSLIMGESVVIERAVNCEILAGDVQVGSAEGCGVAGKKVGIGSSRSCRDKQTIVAMLVPALTQIDAQINQVDKATAECRQAIAANAQELARIKSDGEVAQYLALAASLQQGGVKLTAAQQENWQKMTARFDRTRRMMEKLDAGTQEQSGRIQAFEQERAHLLEEREKSGEGIHCGIAEVAGDTRVRTMIAPQGIGGFQQAAASELRIKLREPGLSPELVFLGDEGGLDWNYKLPELDSFFNK
ncbi:MAG: DUF342 domain-containing protein [Nitrosomonadales bacterium]|nr:DUF342 domain-containing protein [Nitrosomonadales bacterium]